MKSIVFTGAKGLFENIDPMQMNPEQCTELTNLKPDGIGRFIPVNDLGASADEYDADIVQKLVWESSNRYNYNADFFSDNSIYYILLGSDGTLSLRYSKDTNDTGDYGYITLGAVLDIDKFMWSADTERFVWVDGFLNSKAKQIAIDADGVLHYTDIGVNANGYIGTVNLLSMTSDESNTGMGVSAGGIFQYCITGIDKFGQESNPSAILSISEFIALWKGELEETTVGHVTTTNYVFSSALHGKGIMNSLSFTIDAGIYEKVRLYRRWCPYMQGVTPFTAWLQVAEHVIGASKTSFTILDASPVSAVALPDGNSVAGSANDIMLMNGSVILGNASTEIDFPVAFDKAWEIKLDNVNPCNYVDGTFKIDLFDKTFVDTIGLDVPYLEDLDWSEHTTMDNFRFVYEDRITPIRFIDYKNLKHIVFDINDDSFIVKGCRVVLLEIPLALANSVTKIYLLYSSTGFDNTVYDYDKFPYPIDFYDYIDDGKVLDNDLHFFNLARPLNENSIATIKNFTDDKATDITEYQNLSAGDLYITPDDDSKIYSESIEGLNVHLFDTVPNNSAQFTIFHLLPKWISCLKNDTILPQMAPFGFKSERVITKSKGTISFWLYAPKNNYPDTPLPVVKIKNALNGSTLSINHYVNPETNRYCFLPYYYDGETESTHNSTGVSFDATYYWDNYFIVLSWKTTKTGEGTGYTKMYFTVHANSRALSNGGYVRTQNVTATNILFGEGECTLDIEFGHTMLNPSLYTYVWYFSSINIRLGEYLAENLDNYMARALQLASTRCDFPAGIIGLSGSKEDIYLYDATHYCFINRNITMRKITLNESNKNGVIKFGMGGSIDNTTEINVNEEILRLAYYPIDVAEGKSNTIFAMCRKRPFQVIINGATAFFEQIKPLEGYGLTGLHAMCVFNDAIMWNTPNGVMYMSRQGFRNLSLDQLNATIIGMWYLPDRDHVFMLSDEGVCYCLDMLYGVLFKLDYGNLIPENICIDENGEPSYFVDKDGYNIYREYDFALKGTIVSGVMPMNKLHSLMSEADLVTVTPILIDYNLTNGKHNLTAMKLDAIRRVVLSGAKADYFQLKAEVIAPADAIEGETIVSSFSEPIEIEGIPYAEAPTTLTAEAVSATEIDLAWTDNSDNEWGFKVERSLTGTGDWGIVAILPHDTTEYQDMGLESDTTYYYRVYSYTDVGNSDYSNIANDTTMNPLYDEALHLVALFMPDSIVTAGTEPVKVSQWTNKIDSGKSMVQTSDANRPLYNIDGDFPGVYTDATDAKTLVFTTLAGYISKNKKFTFLYMVRDVTDDDYRGLFYTISGTHAIWLGIRYTGGVNKLAMYLWESTTSYSVISDHNVIAGDVIRISYDNTTGKVHFQVNMDREETVDVLDTYFPDPATSGIFAGHSWSAFGHFIGVSTFVAISDTCTPMNNELLEYIQKHSG